MNAFADKRRDSRLTVRQAAEVFNRKFDRRFTAPDLCKIEGRVYNPMPACLELMAETYGCKTTDLVSPDEVDYGKAAKTEAAIKSAKRREGKKNFAVLLPPEYIDGLDEALYRRGFDSRAEWLMEMIDKLWEEVIKERGNIK